MFTQDEIIKMARQAGFEDWWNKEIIDREGLQKHLEAFAKLVMENDLLRLTTLAEMLSNAQAVEREECARVCEKEADLFDNNEVHYEVCAKAIRARGEPTSRGEA